MGENGDAIPGQLQEPKFIRGYGYYVKLSGVIPEGIEDEVDDIKERGRCAFVPELGGLETAWDIRPLPKLLQLYAACDICFMEEMKYKWQRPVELDNCVRQLSRKRMREAAKATPEEREERDFGMRDFD